MIANPWIILAVVLAFLGAGVGGYTKGRTDANAKWSAVAAEKEREARTREQQLQEQTNAITNQYQSEKDAISANLANALERLRQRPKRLPEAARTACQGGTGAELSNTDAGFLEREAARADELRAALSACQSWANTVTH